MSAGPKSGGDARGRTLRGKGSRLAAWLLGSSLVAMLAASGAASAPSTLSAAQIDQTEVSAIAAALPAAADTIGAPTAAAIEARRQKTAAELAEIADRIELSDSTVRSLDDELVAIAADRDKLTAALTSATEAQRRISASLEATEQRVAALDGEEDAIRASLAARRDVLAEVLAALERLGRKPPPALLVRPRDALGAVRSAILLGAVVPTMRTEAAALVADLDKLSGVKRAIVDEKDRFAGQMTQHREEAARLERLFAEKKRIEAASRERRQAETARAAELARKADGLKDLISSLQAEADAAKAREVARRKAEEQRLAEAAALEARQLAEAAARKELSNREIASAREALALARDRQLKATEAGRTLTAEGQTGRVTAPRPGDKPAAPTDMDMAALVPDTPARAPSAVVPIVPPAEDMASLEPAPSTTGDAQQESGDGAATPAQPDSLGAELTPAPSAKPAYDIAALRNNTMLLEPAAAFSTLKARLSKPLLGRQIIGFGEKDDIGRLSTGLSFASRAGDVVIAPADGRVLYAGPFRSYGELLILDAGDGYHIVLAGMDRIDVSSGQFVSAGEPVALMGARRLASVQVAEFGAAEPALYVEFRKDGKPVDPTPWWTVEPSGRTRNDS